MSDEAPKPTLEESLGRLRNLDEFRVVVAFLKAEREAAISAMLDVQNDGEAMKAAGIVGNLQNVINLLEN